jgi:hypothetical protein
MIEKMSALEAHRAGKLTLPPGYDLEHDTGVLLLRRADGSVTAAFSVGRTRPSEVATVAWQDYGRITRSSA